MVLESHYSFHFFFLLSADLFGYDLSIWMFHSLHIPQKTPNSIEADSFLLTEFIVILTFSACIIRNMSSNVLEEFLANVLPFFVHLIFWAALLTTASC